MVTIHPIHVTPRLWTCCVGAYDVRCQSLTYSLPMNNDIPKSTAIIALPRLLGSVEMFTSDYVYPLLSKSTTLKSVIYPITQFITYKKF